MRTTGFRHFFYGCIIFILLSFFLCGSGMSDPVIMTNYTIQTSGSTDAVFTLIGSDMPVYPNQTFMGTDLLPMNQSEYGENNANFDLSVIYPDAIPDEAGETESDVFSAIEDDISPLPSENGSTGSASIVPVIPLEIDPEVVFSPEMSNPVPTESADISSGYSATEIASLLSVPDSIIPVSPTATSPGLIENAFVSVEPTPVSLSFSSVPDSTIPVSPEAVSPGLIENVSVSAVSTPVSLSFLSVSDPTIPVSPEAVSPGLIENVSVSAVPTPVSLSFLSVPDSTIPVSPAATPPGLIENVSVSAVSTPISLSFSSMTESPIPASSDALSPGLIENVSVSAVPTPVSLSFLSVPDSTIPVSPAATPPGLIENVSVSAVSTPVSLSFLSVPDSTIPVSPGATSPGLIENVSVSAVPTPVFLSFSSMTESPIPSSPDALSPGLIENVSVSAVPTPDTLSFLSVSDPTILISPDIPSPVSSDTNQAFISQPEYQIVSTNSIEAPVFTTEPNNLNSDIPSGMEPGIETVNSTLIPNVFTDLSVVSSVASGTSDLSSYTNSIQPYEDNPSEIEAAYADGEVIVCFAEEESVPLTEAVYIATHEKIGAEMIESLSAFGQPQIQLVRLPVGIQVTDALAYYEADPAVSYAEPNYKVTASIVPDDPDYDQLWAMNEVSAPEAWDRTTGSSDVIVAIVDSGVDYTHPDLAANMWVNTNEIPDNGIDDDKNGFVDDYRGWDFFSEDPDPMDENGHGTHCAGTIGAVGNNGVGIAGYNWQVRLMPLKFLGPDGSGHTFDATQAVLYGSLMGAQVMNHSWGGGAYSKTLKDALGASSAVMAVCGGNDGKNLDQESFYPASYDCENIISVAATDSNGDLAYFSNYGMNSIDVAAPGVAILSTVLNGGYEYYKGTSMATPQVSGLAALICAADPSASSLDIIRTIISHTTPSSKVADKVKSGGVIDAYACVNAVWQNPLHADATIQPLEGKAPLTINCTGSATGSPTSWMWDFGDYTPSVEGQVVTHTYESANNYPVTLQVSDTTNSDAVTKLVTVNPAAAFTANVTTGDIPLTVSFTSQSTGGTPDKIIWKFGDGILTDETSPVHTYTSAGTYTVTLLIERRGLSDQLIKTGYIVATDPQAPITAAFTADPQSGPAPLSVSFTDRSTGPVFAWLWDFGDQTQSDEQNPTHLYSCPGEYTVILSVFGAGEEDSAMSTILVTDESEYFLPLDSGWNLVSTPKKLASGHNTAGIFADVDTGGHSILTYDPYSSDWVVLTADSPIDPLYGYWIYARTATSVPLIFESDPVVVPLSRELIAGWNIIGFAKINPATAHDTMLSVQDAWIYVIGYDGGLQRYEETIINGGSGAFSDTRLMYPSKGYWTYMNQSGILAGIGL